MFFDNLIVSRSSGFEPILSENNDNLKLHQLCKWCHFLVNFNCLDLNYQSQNAHILFGFLSSKHP